MASQRTLRSPTGERASAFAKAPATRHSFSNGGPNNASFLADLKRDLKRAYGVAVTDDGVTLQGDGREKIRELLSARGFLVKG